ncbi:MAG: M12 family metallo-peptidase [Bacteroidota bacterium]
MRKNQNGVAYEDELFAKQDESNPLTQTDFKFHVYNGDKICVTDTIGYVTPRNRSPNELVLEASDGFIPLWAPKSTLRWRFNEAALQHFKHPEDIKREVKLLLGEAIVMWGDAAPVKFTERYDAWDFEVVVSPHNNCSMYGCTLAKAFFPDSGRHELTLYPSMFKQVRKEQVDTLIHELGHIFGLRHFFANVSEKAFPSTKYGKHSSFSIMNYGAKSELTENDRSDLRRLYQESWSGERSEVNGTPIVLVSPFHELVTNKTTPDMRARNVQPVAPTYCCHMNHLNRKIPKNQY